MAKSKKLKKKDAAGGTGSKKTNKATRSANKVKERLLGKPSSSSIEKGGGKEDQKRKRRKSSSSSECDSDDDPQDGAVNNTRQKQHQSLRQSDDELEQMGQSSEESDKEPLSRIQQKVLNEDTASRRKDPLYPYRKAAWYICRFIRPWMSYGFLLDALIRRESETWRSVASNEKMTKDEFLEEYDLYLMCGDGMIARIPGFEQEIPILAKDPDYHDALASVFDTAHSRARSNDIGSLRDAGLQYLADVQPNGILVPPINPMRTKASVRGFKHPVIARLLCPSKFYFEFKADPARVTRKMKAGEKPYRVTGRSLLTLLYDESKMEEDDLSAGLLESPLVIKVYQHIYSGPTSATEFDEDEERPATKRGQGKLNSMRSAFMPAIAYACLMTYWMLCSCKDWRDDDYPFDREAFFETILSAAEDLDEIAIKAGEECFTDRIVKIYSRAAHGARSGDTSSDSDREDLSDEDRNKRMSDRFLLRHQAAAKAAKRGIQRPLSRTASPQGGDVNDPVPPIKETQPATPTKPAPPALTPPATQLSPVRAAALAAVDAEGRRQGLPDHVLHAPQPRRPPSFAEHQLSVPKSQHQPRLHSPTNNRALLGHQNAPVQRSHSPPSPPHSRHLFSALTSEGEKHKMHSPQRYQAGSSAIYQQDSTPQIRDNTTRSHQQHYRDSRGKHSGSDSPLRYVTSSPSPSSIYPLGYSQQPIVDGDKNHSSGAYSTSPPYLSTMQQQGAHAYSALRAPSNGRDSHQRPYSSSAIHVPSQNSGAPETYLHETHLRPHTSHSGYQPHLQHSTTNTLTTGYLMGPPAQPGPLRYERTGLDHGAQNQDSRVATVPQRKHIPSHSPTLQPVSSVPVSRVGTEWLSASRRLQGPQVVSETVPPRLPAKTPPTHATPPPHLSGSNTQDSARVQHAVPRAPATSHNPWADPRYAHHAPPPPTGQPPQTSLVPLRTYTPQAGHGQPATSQPPHGTGVHAVASSTTAPAQSAGQVSLPASTKQPSYGPDTVADSIPPRFGFKNLPIVQQPTGNPDRDHGAISGRYTMPPTPISNAPTAPLKFKIPSLRQAQAARAQLPRPSNGETTGSTRTGQHEEAHHLWPPEKDPKKRAKTLVASTKDEGEQKKKRKRK